ncbi:MAG TPA: FkbM family methyltransferase, partial [Patescibacteria group bacterium]
TIFYPNIYSFFFLFNEIFCKAEYPSIKMLNNYIDLGANIGMSIIWYNLFNPSAKIYAYEPDPICYKYLKKTLKINHIANVSIFKKAVSNRTGKVKFFRILDNIQQLDSGLTLNQSLPHKVYVIKTQKLSTLLKKIKKIDLIKMDIEGAEYKVFQDLFSTNSISKVTTIIFEAHIFNKTEENQYKSILKKLQKLGLVTSHKNSIYSTINFWTKK